MSREDEFQVLEGKLRSGHIFDCRDELECFLNEDPDAFTEQLQKAIDNKLGNPGFHHQNFSDFLEDYRQNNPSDPSGYSNLQSEIYGVQ
jgi:hypothetical protein